MALDPTVKPLLLTVEPSSAWQCYWPVGLITGRGSSKVGISGGHPSERSGPSLSPPRTKFLSECNCVAYGREI